MSMQCNAAVDRPRLDRVGLAIIVNSYAKQTTLRLKKFPTLNSL